MTYLEIVTHENPKFRKFDVTRSNCPSDFNDDWPSVYDKECDMECRVCWNQSVDLKLEIS